MLVHASLKAPPMLPLRLGACLGYMCGGGCIISHASLTSCSALQAEQEAAVLAQELHQARDSMQLVQQQQQQADQKRVTHRGTATDAVTQQSNGVQCTPVAGTIQPRHDQAGRSSLEQQRQEPVRR